MSNNLDGAGLLAQLGIDEPLDELLKVETGRFEAWSRLAAVVAPIVADKKIRLLGVEGSQGSGKSTLSQTIVDALAARGIKAATISLDDFYLGVKEREALAARIHPLLRTRGVPGTHDWQRLLEVVLAHERGEALTVPRFNKGTDDRMDDVCLECECLILEGWCVGITQQAPSQLLEPVNKLERTEDLDAAWRIWANEQIQHYEPIWSHIQFWLQLRVPSFEQVYLWRAQQEQDLPREQRMSDDTLSRFIQHYERITRHLWSLPPRHPGLTVELSASHDIAKVAASQG